MRKSECQRLAQEVRDFILGLSLQKITDEWGRDLGGGCAVASYTLAEYLKKHDFEAILVEGEFRGDCHCWVEVMCDNEWVIVDITATQFGRKYREVEIVDPEYEDYVPLNRGEDVWASLEEWPSEQKPSHYMDYIERFLSKKAA